MNPLFGAVAALAKGRSEIRDLRYPNRFSYLEELKQLGLVASATDGRATIDGAGRISGGNLRARDLRGGMAFVLAAIGADDPITVQDCWQVLRGYSQLTRKLTDVGIPWSAVEPA
jgi:UDP-N-acetylglucosamine 1-carboxyvinyltransferase